VNFIKNVEKGVDDQPAAAAVRRDRHVDGDEKSGGEPEGHAVGAVHRALLLTIDNCDDLSAER
jgi:hypothetical protein